jgi:SAM-dependent methyltransferase
MAECKAKWNIDAATFTGMCSHRRFHALAVAELNSCGALHPFLCKHPRLAYSEYTSHDPAVPSQDLLALTYDDRTFDLILTSDTLEHVPDFPKALSEIRRVLKPTGLHIFTVPVTWDFARTEVCCHLEGERLVHDRQPSYHGDQHCQDVLKHEDMLVCYQFGADLEDLVRSCGFMIRTVRDAANPALSTFITCPSSPG